MAEKTTTAALTRQTTAPASTGNLTETSGEPWFALTILLVASFMGVLDVFIVNVAVPSIQSETNASFADIQLIVAGYTLAYSVGLVTGGRLGDAFGRRRIFLGGTALFGLASVGCSIAPNATTLILLRVLQGLSAAVMLPQVLALIQIIFTPANRAKAIGFYGAALGLGAVTGQVVGGGLLAWNPLDLGWRSIFLVNAPLCLLTMIGTVLVVDGPRVRDRAHFDLVGAGLLGLALFGLLDPVITAGESGWSTANTAELVAALALFAAFGRWERRLSARGGLALLPPALLNQAGFSKGLGAALFFYSGNTAFVLILSYFLQRGLHLTPMQSALEFCPMAAATGIASLSLTSLRARFGHRVVVGGGVLTVTGLLLALPAAGSGNGLTQLLLLQPGLLLYGLGGGLIAPSIVGLSLAETAPDNAGAASGGLLTTTQAANAIGVAAIGALFNAAYSTSGSYRQAFDVSLGVLSGVFVLTVLLLATFRTSTTAAVKDVPR